MMICGVIFDMDGVMFDTERLAIDAWCQAGKKLGYEITRKMVLKTFGLNKENTKKVWQNIFGTDFPFEQALKLRLDYAAEKIEEQGIPIKPGLKELIVYLQEKQILFTIATSSEEKKVRRYLEKAELSHCFSEIVCGDQVKKGKPEPDIYRKAAETLGVPAQDCIAIEDSAAGILSAYRAGLKPVMIPDILQPDEETKTRIYAKKDSLKEMIFFLEEENHF